MHERPRLSRDLVSLLALEQNGGALDLPPAATLGLPERVVQFGTGAFLRGFVEYFIDDANRAGRFNGSVVAVASTGSRRDAVLNEQDGLYTLAIQETDGTSARLRYRVIASLNRALSARDEWDAVLALARDPAIELVVSNATEVGLAIGDDDAFDACPPKSFPAKLTRFLAERAAAFDYDATRPLIVLPCELIDDNASVLRGLVYALAERWAGALDARFVPWLDRAVSFCNTLVDRIVPGPVPAREASRMEQLFGYRDGLATACESYALFAIEGDAEVRARLAFPGEDSRIVVAPDIRPYRERKVRVLNGAHTIMVPAALLAGLDTVYQAMTDERIGRFVRRAVLDEIVPALDVPDVERFARDVLDRFANPYLEHALIDITLQATTKMRVRVVPSIVAHVEQLRRVPAALAFGFAAYLEYMRGDLQLERRAAGLAVPPDDRADRVLDAWRSVDVRSDAALAELARRVSGDEELWGVDLSALPGFVDAVAEQLGRIARSGVCRALDAHLTEPAII